ncbi:MAG: glycerol-3-phosphate acyltransferase, partial [Betaproteobacteria bacterium HGW-Betaproteobacteria-8]
WILAFAIWRYSSLAAILAAAFSPLFAWNLLDGNVAYFVATVVLALLLIWRHRSNIRNLLNGTEGGFSKGKS